MTCDHCASAVRAEISRLTGVAGVDVDVAAGTVRISGDPVPGDAQLPGAVEEAGYEFAGRLPGRSYPRGVLAARAG
jgi:copper chaperone